MTLTPQDLTRLASSRDQTCRPRSRLGPDAHHVHADGRVVFRDGPDGRALVDRHPALRLQQDQRVTASASRAASVWIGSTGFLVRIVPQTLGGADRPDGPGRAAVWPTALRSRAPRPDPHQSRLGGASRERFSSSIPSRPSRSRCPSALAPGETAFFPDAFVGASAALALSPGPSGFRSRPGRRRTSSSPRGRRAYLESGSFGFQLPAQSAAEVLQAGQIAHALHGSALRGRLVTFGYFSPTGGAATVDLIAPDGTVRGTQTITVESNVIESYNPAALVLRSRRPSRATCSASP